MEKKEYIERGAALLAITGQPSELHYPSWYKGNIMEVPAADVAPVVHGEWIKNNNERSCPECGFTYYTIIDTFNYCPHCGVKMDGGKE